MNKPILYVNLDELQDFPEKFLMAKMDIESDVEQENKLPLSDFIVSLNMTNVYVYKKQMIPFSIREGNNSKYVIYISSTPYKEIDLHKQLREEAFEKFKEKLSSIDYDISKLSMKTNIDLISTSGIEVIEHGEYFVIDGEFYI